MSLLPPAQAAQLRSFYELTVIIQEGFPAIGFEFWLDSPFDGGNPLTEAWRIVIDVVVGPEMVVDGVTGGTWNETVYHVNGDYTNSNLTATVSPETQAAMIRDSGTTLFASINVTVTYTDNEDARARTIHRTVTFDLNYQPTFSLPILPAAVLGLGGAGAFGVALFAIGRARLEELYLMHDSGLLIRHWSRANGTVHDSDIMSGMFIVLQEFVRDSFSDRKGSLEHLRFGKRQVIMARGRNTILAAVVRGRYLNGLPGKLEEAVQRFEGAYRDILPTWNGNLALFPQVDRLADHLIPARRRSSAS